MEGFVEALPPQDLSFLVVVAGFAGLRLAAGDRLVTVLQNRWEAATLHWACQFAGVVITDSLDSAAGLRGWATPEAALRSAAAGADLLLITGSAATSRGTFVTLVDAARSGTLPRAALEQSYTRILALKRRLR